MKYTMIINRYLSLETLRIQTDDLFKGTPLNYDEGRGFYHVVGQTLGEDEPPSDLYIRWRDIESVEQYANDL